MICDSPSAIKKQLDLYVVGQEQAKWDLAHAFFLYEMRLHKTYKNQPTDFRSHVMFVGPSGCGKTFLIQTLARITEIPLITVDCSTLSAPGWSGSSIFDELNRQSSTVTMGGRNNLAIILLDEIDKVAGPAISSSGYDHNAGIQSSLLWLLDGKEASGGKRNCAINSGLVFVVAAGAFEDLKTVSGYKDDIRKTLVTAGIKQELIGRFISVSRMDKLSFEELYVLLFNSESSPIAFYKEVFKKLDIPFELTGIEKEQLKTLLDKEGVRSLNSTVFELMKSRLEQIPDSQILLSDPPLTSLPSTTVIDDTFNPYGGGL